MRRNIRKDLRESAQDILEWKREGYSLSGVYDAVSDNARIAVFTGTHPTLVALDVATVQVLAFEIYGELLPEDFVSRGREVVQNLRDSMATLPPAVTTEDDDIEAEVAEKIAIFEEWLGKIRQEEVFVTGLWEDGELYENIGDDDFDVDFDTL